MARQMMARGQRLYLAIAALLLAALPTVAFAQRFPRPSGPPRPSRFTLPQPAPFEFKDPAVEGGVVVALLNLDRSPLGTVLEARLRNKNIVNFWPRSARAKLLDKLAISTAIDLPPAGDVEELALPDALLLFRTQLVGKETVAEVVVCEPGLGLRLGYVRAALTKDVVADADKLLSGAIKALGKLGEPMQELWAVPPFHSKDLGTKHDDLRLHYARVVEEELLRRKGAFVAELEYAYAIALARRHAGVKEPLRRMAPIYMAGEYRNLGEGDKRAVIASVETYSRAGTGEASVTPGLPPAEAENRLREQTQRIGKELGGSQDREETDTVAEIGTLASLSKDFQKAGDVPGQLAMIEASLLLNPSNPQQAIESLSLLGKLTRLHWDKGREPVPFRQVSETLPGGGISTKSIPNEQFPEQLQEGLTGMNYFSRGLMRMRDIMAEPTGGRDPGRVMSFYPSEFMTSFQGTAPRPEFPRGYVAAAQRLSDEQNAIWLQIVRRDAREGRATMPLVWGSSTALERMDLVLRLITEIQDHPQAENMVMSYVLGGVGAPLLKSPEGDVFLAQLAAIPNANVSAAVAKIKDQVAKYEVPQPGPATPEPPDVDEAKADVRFVPLNLAWKNLPAGQPELKAFCEAVIAAGKDADLFCADGQILLMKKKGETKLILDASGQGYTFKHSGGYGPAPIIGCYDGRYAWVPMLGYGKASRLFVVDTEKEKATEITEADGLPSEIPEMNLSPLLSVAPLAPGKVMLCGYFGKTWIGIATFDGEKKSVKVIHEAHEVPGRDNREQWRSTAMVFQPVYMYTLHDGGKEKQAQRVIIGRAAADSEIFTHPIIVDPEAAKVTVVEKTLNPGVTSVMDSYDGSLYWVQHSSSNQNMAAEFMKLGFPDFEPRSLGEKHPLPGKGYHLAFGRDAQGFHIFHDQWLTAKGPDEPFKIQSGNLPKNERTSPRFLRKSNHYGWVVIPANFNRGYAVEFAKDEKPSEGKVEGPVETEEPTPDATKSKAKGE